MVHIRTILTLSIAILVIDNVLIEAGKATEDRQKNLSTRASTHMDGLRQYQNGLKNKFGDQINSQVKKQLSDISDIIIKYVMKHKSFSKYLKNVFSVLQKYAVNQIESRFKKLKNVYTKWENQNFPDKIMKANALKILDTQEKEKKDLAKKSKKKVKESVVKNRV